MPVGDVDLPQPAPRRGDPITDLACLDFGEGWIDQYGVILSRDQRRGDRRPHPGAAIGKRTASRLRNLPCDKYLVLQRLAHAVTPAIASVNSRTTDARASGYSTCSQ